MNSKTTFDIPHSVKEVSLTLTRAGYENFLVGGCVRDLLLGKKPKDWDITTRAKPEEVEALFPKTFYENEYGTVGVVNEDEEDPTLKTVEVTPYRTESEYSDHRRPDEVKWADTLEEDLARRDFTVNAVALDVETGDIIDPFDGQKDMEKKLIRTVGKPEERFKEDALRMLRALRFASEHGFAIEHDTQEAIEQHAELLSHISKERIRDEFTKIVMSENPGVALELSARMDLLRYIAPELEKGIGVEQNQAHAYTVWEHLIRSLNQAAKKECPLHVRLAALFHDVAKPHTRAWKPARPSAEGGNGQWTFYGHEVVGSRIARSTLNDLRYPKDVVDKVTKLVRWHMFFSDTEEITLSAVRRMVRNVSPELIWDLMAVRNADRVGTGRPKETTYRLRKYHSMIEQVLRDPISVKQLAVDGKDIMDTTSAGAGPHIGHILEILLSEVLEDPGLNTKEYLEKRVRELYALDVKELAKQGREARERNAGEEEKEVEKIKEQYKVR